MASKAAPAPKITIKSVKIASAASAAKPITAKKTAKLTFPNTTMKSQTAKAPRAASVNPTVKTFKGV